MHVPVEGREREEVSAAAVIVILNSHLQQTLQDIHTQRTHSSQCLSHLVHIVSPSLPHTHTPTHTHTAVQQPAEEYRRQERGESEDEVRAIEATGTSEVSGERHPGPEERDPGEG